MKKQIKIVLIGAGSKDFARRVIHDIVLEKELSAAVKVHAVLVDIDEKRLKAMAETSDGFILAEKDLEQRGAGDFLGTRQSGFSELKMASLTDLKLIENARLQAQAVFEQDPDLSKLENQCLVDAMERFWQHSGGDIS